MWAEPGSLWLDSYSSSPDSARSSTSGTPASITATQTELCQNHGRKTKYTISHQVQFSPGSNSACRSRTGPAPRQGSGGSGTRGRLKQGSTKAEGFGTSGQRPWWGFQRHLCIAAPKGLHSTYSGWEDALPNPGPDWASLTAEDQSEQGFDAAGWIIQSNFINSTVWPAGQSSAWADGRPPESSFDPLTSEPHPERHPQTAVD